MNRFYPRLFGEVNGFDFVVISHRLANLISKKNSMGEWHITYVPLDSERMVRVHLYLLMAGPRGLLLAVKRQF